MMRLMLHRLLPPLLPGLLHRVCAVDLRLIFFRRQEADDAVVTMHARVGLVLGVGALGDGPAGSPSSTMRRRKSMYSLPMPCPLCAPSQGPPDRQARLPRQNLHARCQTHGPWDCPRSRRPRRLWCAPRWRRGALRSPPSAGYSRRLNLAMFDFELSGFH